MEISPIASSSWTQGASSSIAQELFAVRQWIGRWPQFLILSIALRFNWQLSFLNHHLGRPNTRVTSRQIDYKRANREFMSRSNRSYGFTCVQVLPNQRGHRGAAAECQFPLLMPLRQYLFNHQRIDVDYAVLNQVQLIPVPKSVRMVWF